MQFSVTRANFPDDFRFGTATAAYQIEGTSFGTVGSCHWDTFAATPGNVHKAQDGAVACDPYHRFEEDLDLVKDAGFDVYRFSAAWTRVMPDGRTVSREGLDFYDRLADAICERGLAPNLTLYHWDLPSTLADIGGWANRDIPMLFADYARTVMARIGDRVDAVATLNEPWCVAWLSHFLGIHAPGLRDIRAAARAMHHVMLAHGTGLQAIRAESKADAGIVLNFCAFQPATDTAEDAAAAERMDGIHNRWFVEAATKGRYPADTLEALAPHMPDGFDNDMALISQPIDWLGLNYYTRNLMAHDANQPWPHLREVPGDLPKTDQDWEIYPDGLRQFLTRMAREYTGELPLYVSENGMAAADILTDGGVHDEIRVRYYDDHLAAVRQAIDEGAPVKGYFAWSLLDNYEWAFGYDKRFGLVHVDFQTQARTPKASFGAFRTALREN